MCRKIENTRTQARKTRSIAGRVLRAIHVVVIIGLVLGGSAFLFLLVASYQLDLQRTFIVVLGPLGEHTVLLGTRHRGPDDVSREVWKTLLASSDSMLIIWVNEGTWWGTWACGRDEGLGYAQEWKLHYSPMLWIRLCRGKNAGYWLSHSKTPLWLPTLVLLLYPAAQLVLWMLRCVRRRRRLRRGHRGSCGYDLTGNVTGTCPECGTATPLGKAAQLTDTIRGTVAHGCAGSMMDRSKQGQS